jgi:hypothetical protein
MRAGLVRMWRHDALRTWLAVAVVGALLGGWSATGSAAAADPPSGSPVSTPGLMPGKALLEKVYEGAAKQAAAQAAQRKTLAASAQISVRRQSRTSFAGLGTSAAVTLARKTFPDVLTAPGAVPLRDGQQADHYLDAHTARIRGGGPDGDNALVTSDRPLATKDAAGDLVPVDISLTGDASSGWAPKNALEPYRIGASSSTGVAFTQEGLGVRPDGASVDGAVQDSTIFYPNTQTDTDTLLKPLDDGVEVYWQLRSAQSPEELGLNIDLPDGAGLTQPGPLGVKIVRDAKTIGTISPVMATDADGQPVKTTLQVQGTKVVVSVAHRDADVHYPVMVDPTVAASYIFPFDGVDTAYNAWATYSYPAVGKFALLRGNKDPDPFAYWGEGLYINNAGYPSTLGFTGGPPGSADHAGFYYTAPGQARIFQVDNSDSKNILGDNLAICMIVGIAKPGVSDWDGPYGTTYGEGCTAFADFAWHMRVDPAGSGTPGNTFVFGDYAYSSGNWAFNDYFRDAVIYMDDADAPSITQVNAPDDEWINGDNTGAIRAFAKDPSTGVNSLNFTGPQGWTAQSINPNCAYGPCGTPWDNGDAEIPVSSLPEGNDTISITASDPAGNISAPSTIELAVDHTGPPTPTLNTPSYDMTTGETHISWRPVTDPPLADGTDGSGLAGYAYRYATGGGATSAWQTTAAPIFTVPGTTDGQSFDVEVRGIDAAGNAGASASGTLSSTPPSDATPPTLSLSGPLYSQTGLTLNNGYWGLSAHAEDGTGSGIAQISVSVDGQHMTFDGGRTVVDGFEVGVQGQICGDPGCSLDLQDVPFDTSEYAEGARNIDVTAMDFAGNTTSQSFSVVNSHTDVPPYMGDLRTSMLSTKQMAVAAKRPTFTAYQAGPSFDGLPMTSAASYRAVIGKDERPQEQVTYWYGSCMDMSGAPCDPPIQVQSSPQRLKNVNLYNDGPAPPKYTLVRIRGVPAALFNRGRTLEIYTGKTTISIYGDRPAQVRRFARIVAPASARDVPDYGTEVHHVGPPAANPGLLPPPTIKVQQTRASTRGTLGDHYDLPQITSDSPNCSTQKDPVNVVFVGKSRLAGETVYMDEVTAKGEIGGILHWTNTGTRAGGKQWASDPATGSCNLMSGQNATTYLALQKHHARSFQLSGLQHDKGVVAIGVHRDVRDHDCDFHDTVPGSIGYSDGRIRTGFDVGQREFLDAFSNGHESIGYQDGPGTYTSAQCDPRTGVVHQVPWNGRIQFFEFSLDDGS